MKLNHLRQLQLPIRWIPDHLSRYPQHFLFVPIEYYSYSYCVLPFVRIVTDQKRCFPKITCQRPFEHTTTSNPWTRVDTNDDIRDNVNYTFFQRIFATQKLPRAVGAAGVSWWCFPHEFICLRCILIRWPILNKTLTFSGIRERSVTDYPEFTLPSSRVVLLP